MEADGCWCALRSSKPLWGVRSFPGEFDSHMLPPSDSFKRSGIMERFTGTTSRGIRTPIIRDGDNLCEIVVDSVIRAAETEKFDLQDRKSVV